MAKVYFEGFGILKIPMERSRRIHKPDTSNSDTFNSAVNNNLLRLLFEHAKDHPTVRFYDIGCGEGMLATDIFPEFRNYAKERGENPELGDKIVYTGIDKVAGDAWRESPQVRFIEGDVSDVLSQDRHTIDVGLAYFVLPYEKDKLRRITRIASSLSSAGGKAILFPHYRGQIRAGQPLDLRGNNGIKIEITGDSELPMLTIGRQGEGEWNIPHVFSHATYDCFQYRPKGGLEGRAGQFISHYTLQ